MKMLVKLCLFGTLLFSIRECSAQEGSINWKPCSELISQWQGQVEEFNKKHATDGLQIWLSCEFHDPGPKEPVKKIKLTPEEAAKLDDLRGAANEAYKAEDALEDQLIRAHGIHRPKVGDQCWYFVGIVFDTHYITVDPNSGFQKCKPRK